MWRRAFSSMACQHALDYVLSFVTNSFAAVSF